MTFPKSLPGIGLLFAAVFAGAKPPLMTPPETPVLGEVDAALIETLYRSRDPDAGLDAALKEPGFRAVLEKHQLRLLGGPMLGCVTPTSARIWVRTVGPASVRVVLHTGDGPRRSEAVSTTAETDYTALIPLEGLRPFTTYRYDVLVDGTPALADPLPEFRTHPTAESPARFAVGFGGCARYVPEHEYAWDTIAALKPQAFLFLGDNIYIDEPDWRGKQRAMYYRRQLRPEFRRLTAGSAIYAIWDDHDFGVNDCAGGPARFKPAWKVKAWEVFRENWNNPAYGGGKAQPGCWFETAIGGVDFFMTDGRYYRDFKRGTMLGPAQKAWLLERLAASRATFKVLASGTLWTGAADKGGRDSWWGVKEEREEILGLIDKARIPGVILISSDRHRTDIYRIPRPEGYDLYEFETGKITNWHTHPTNPRAEFSYNKGNFFGLLRFDLAAEDPAVTFECIDIGGRVIHRKTLTRSALTAPR